MMITNSDDIIYLSDIKDKIKELEDLKNSGEIDEDDEEELKVLNDLEEEIGLKVKDGVLIRNSYFTEYAREEAENLGEDLTIWPFNHIDWEDAADELTADYIEVDFDGESYFFQER